MVSPSNCIYLKYSLYIFINVSCGLTEILSMVLQNLVKSFILFRMMRTNVKYSNFLYAHLKYVENGHKDQCTYYVFLGGFNETYFICHTFLASCIPFLSNIPACIYNEGWIFNRCPKTIVLIQHNETQC